MCGSRERDRIRIDNVFEAKDRTMRIGKKVYLKIGSNMLPQREVFGDNTDIRISLYGNNKVVPSFGISVYPLQQLLLDGNTELRNDVNIPQCFTL